MTIRRAVAMGLLSFLVGCFSSGSKSSPFQQKDGQWYYRDTPITGSDAGSFQILDDHYAKDARRVYFGDTYRKGQEYYSIKHSRVETIEGADAASFAMLDREYARDARRVYRDGAAIPVRDPSTFQLIPGRLFAHDAKVGYYNGWEIPGSIGAAFVVISDHYARDSAQVFYCDIEVPPNTHQPQLRAAALPKADLASFVALEYEYARDAHQAYYQERVIARNPDTFEVLDDGYARTGSMVFYRGDVLKGANAATFVVTNTGDKGIIGSDGTRSYWMGRLQ